jgi:membrane protein DedA with SNARE-associated domain
MSFFLVFIVGAVVGIGVGFHVGWLFGHNAKVK